MEKMTIGKLGEIAVREYLVQQGCFVVQCNYHAAGGHHEEIDIIACDGKHLIFTEVKSRKEGAMVAAQLALTPQKRRRVLLCAQRFLMNHTSFACYQPRFDGVRDLSRSAGGGTGVLSKCLFFVRYRFVRRLIEYTQTMLKGMKDYETV